MKLLGTIFKILGAAITLSLLVGGLFAYGYIEGAKAGKAAGFNAAVQLTWRSCLRGSVIFTDGPTKYYCGAQKQL